MASKKLWQTKERTFPDAVVWTPLVNWTIQMECLEEVTKEFLCLCSTTDLMNGAVMFQNLFDGAAIAEPKEFKAPTKFAILADGPASTTVLATDK